MPPLWVIAQNDPLILSKLQTWQAKTSNIFEFFCSILPNSSWNLTVSAHQICKFSCPDVPAKDDSALLCSKDFPAWIK